MLKSIFACLVLLIFFPAVAYTAEGRFEINQACVEQGCFEDDPGGFPIEVTAPGSYFLSSNIVAEDASVRAIRIRSSDVTLNLNGFRINGPTTCEKFPSSPQQCSPAPDIGTGYGIWASQLDEANNVVVKNGSVQGFHSGIRVANGWRIENVRISDNLFRGVSAGSSEAALIIRNSTITRNGTTGIGGSQNSFSVSESTVSHNGASGISIFSNDAVGEAPTSGGLIENNVIHDNNGYIRISQSLDTAARLT